MKGSIHASVPSRRVPTKSCRARSIGLFGHQDRSFICYQFPGMATHLSPGLRKNAATPDSFGDAVYVRIGNILLDVAALEMIVAKAVSDV